MSVSFRVIPLRDLTPNPANVRKDLGDLTELAASIRANGILQPFIVNAVGGRNLVTDGHRRLAAAQLVNYPAAPCLVTAGQNRQQTLATMLATAMHKALTPIEQGNAFDALRNGGMTAMEIARSTGYSVETVRNRLTLLTLPPDAQRMVIRREMTLGEATTLAKQVKATRTGTTTASRGPRNDYFNHAHRLARTVQTECTHSATRRMVGGIGCGQCWEAAIRAEAAAPMAVVA